MKILQIITNTELGGAQKVCIDLCNSAIKEGHVVAVASMEGGYLWGQLPSEVNQYFLKNLVKPIKPLKDIKVVFELLKVKKAFKPDIIHLHSSKAGVLGRIIGLGMKNRVVYTVHGFDSIRLVHRVFLPLERLLQHFCGAIIGVSDYDNKNLKSEKIKKNVSTIYNGISELSINKESAFPFDVTNKKIVMTIARIALHKQFDLFLDVARNFGTDYLFIWIGGEPNLTLEEIYNKYDVPENVKLMGDVPNASKYINLCDLFVLFSNFEGLPMTIIEAMSQKKAIVASDVGGIYELVDDSNGKLIKNDVEEATNAIKTILKDNSKKNNMEIESYNKYNKNFTLEKMWESYKNIYEKLINKGN